KVEGYVFIRSWPHEGIERFKMEVHGLAPGTEVAFEIQDPEKPDQWTLLGTRAAGETGKALYDTAEQDLPLPLDVETVAKLVGLKVRVRFAGDGKDDVILSGKVPELVKT
ncbi:MAG TPA: hypothetical protein VGB42_06515, partial [Candidatus Thermoplasmatota archaeon]